MKKETLENINSDLFNSFNPEDELWIVGGYTFCGSVVLTWGLQGKDTASEGDVDGTLEEEAVTVVS